MSYKFLTIGNRRYFLTYLIIILSYSLLASSHLLAQTKSLEAILIRCGNVRDFTLSRTGTEAYFTVLSPQEEISAIVVTKKEKGTWSEPVFASFSGKYRDLEPFLSPDGLKLYFASNRPLGDNNDKTKDFDIWMVERKALDSVWSEPQNLKFPVNTLSDEFFPTVANNGNLYMTSNRTGSKGKDDIFSCEWNGNSYKEPVSLAPAINTSGYEFNAFISPDESFMIFSGYQREDGLGSGDLYISFKNPNTGWSQAVNLGDKYNSAQMDYCPFYDVQNDLLYFTSKRSFSEFELDSFKSFEDFLSKVNSYKNGLSRIYYLPLKISTFSP